MYEESVGVPLIYTGPGVPAGNAVDAPTQLLDVFPTVLQCTGVEPTDEDRALPGTSLLDIAEGARPERTIVAEQHSAGARSAVFMLRRNGHKYVRYPHNLYLYLALTVGVVGLIAFMILMVTPLKRCISLSRISSVDSYYRGMAKVGIVVMIVIFVDQMKVSFMRISLVDYWHFLFALMGMFVGYCDRGILTARARFRQDDVVPKSDTAVEPELVHPGAVAKESRGATAFYQLRNRPTV